MFGTAMQELICSICKKELDTEDRQPRLLPNTGQTICQICVHNILSDQNINAPSEEEQSLKEIKIQMRLSKDLQINDFPLNQALIRLLSYGGKSTNKENIIEIDDQPMHLILSDQDGDLPDALTTSYDEPTINRNLKDNFLDDLSDSSQKRKSKSSLRQNIKRGSFATQCKNPFEDHNPITIVRQCLIHKRNIEVVCLDCKELICVNCALFGQHKGHTIYSEDDLMMMLTDKAQDIVEKIEVIQRQSCVIQRESFDQRFKDNIKDISNKISNKIKQEFENLKILLKEQESKAFTHIQEQLVQKTQLWDSWWEDNTLYSRAVQQSQDWCFRAKQVIEALADMKSGNNNPYWDLLSWSESIKSNGFTVQRELQNITLAIEQQLNDAAKCTLQLQFNTLPASMAIEDFCRAVKQSTTQIQRIQSPSTISRNFQKIPSNNEDSDLLCNMEELGKSTLLECNDMKQSQYCYSTISEAFYMEPLQQSNRSHTMKSQQGTPSIKFSGIMNASQTRIQRSITPNYIQDVDLSLSPVPLQGKSTQRQKKKSSSIPALTQKLQQQLDCLKQGTFFESVIDFYGQEFNPEIATYLGSEARLWKVKSLKMMKCKLTDDQVNAFFLALGGFNDYIQSINLAQNNLTDRTIDYLKDLSGMEFLNKNLKNIIVSQNKLIARRCQPKILDLKRQGLIITL